MAGKINILGELRNSDGINVTTVWQVQVRNITVCYKTCDEIRQKK